MEPAPSGRGDYSACSNDALFNDAILKQLDYSECSFTRHGLSYACPGPDLVTRPLERGDYAKGYLELLSQLTRVGSYSKEKFEAQFDAMKQMPGCHYIVVVENSNSGRVVASATLVVELKFIHTAALRGRVEDVVVHSDYRQLRLGSMLVELLTMLSKELGCYKVTLDCKENMLGFYLKYGYVNEGQLFLSKRFYE